MTSNKMNAKLKLPSKRDEKWRYSDLKLLEIPNSEASELTRERTFLTQDENLYYIVLLDGKFCKEQSVLPKGGIEISCSKDNIAKFHEGLKFENKFQVLQNLDNNDHIVLINITENIDKPVKLIKLTSSNAAFFTTFLKLEKNYNVKFYENFIQQGEHKNFINNVTRINLGDYASCKHVVQKDFEGEVRFINTLEIVCDANSIYENYSVNAIDKSYRFESEVHLNGTGAKASFNGVNIANNNQAYDIVIDIKHNASDTFSNQHYNQVLNNNSSGSFYSNVEISKSLNAVEAHQLNKNLLIDEKSVVCSRPMLDINSDDVICSHGSTAGNIDEEALNYFASRGIKLQHAKQLIIIGLLKSVFSDCKLDDFEVENLYRQIAHSIEFYE
jgi:Fe-S cluster assembly protein SufD